MTPPLVVVVKKSFLLPAVLLSIHAAPSSAESSDGDAPSPPPPPPPLIPTPTPRPCRLPALSGWRACRPPSPLPSSPDPYYPHIGCSGFSFPPDPDGGPTIIVMNVASLPTTALLTLLENGQIEGAEDVRPEDIYFSTNMDRLPDVENVGRGYYTLMYELDIEGADVSADEVIDNDDGDDGSSSSSGCLAPTGAVGGGGAEVLEQSASRLTLVFAGVNYRASAYLDGVPLPEMQLRPPPSRSGGSIDGMFHRRMYDVTSGGRFSILIEPPLHPGSGRCPPPVPLTANSSSSTGQSYSSSSSSEPCGQGGDHSLAMDGPTAQFMLGWDWARPMPDRATGFFGSVELIRTGRTRLIDVAVLTVGMTCGFRWERDRDRDRGRKRFVCEEVTLRLMARVECFVRANDDGGGGGKSEPCPHGTGGNITATSDWGEEWAIPYRIFKPGVVDVDSEVRVAHHERVRPWWPRGLGIGEEEEEETAHLHTFTFSASIEGGPGGNGYPPPPSHVETVRVGVRTVEPYIDPVTEGQAFRINGRHRIFLAGGNWITTDQALRYSASRDRYCDEVRLHAEAGLNLIRVWGGGVAERDEFYDCADEMGVLVYQEFWMSGDNNGRWAGNYSWPLDHSTYLANVEDTILRLRRHPSLLFYGGGNELWAPPPSNTTNTSSVPHSPPSDIDSGIRSILSRHDPHRFYIPSSFDGGYNGSIPSLHSPEYALAVKDGPYGMLMPPALFERNPGLWSNLTIGFQPEIGSVSAPTYRGLLRFMTVEEAEGGAPRLDGSVGKVWEYHKHEPWTTGRSYDHVLAYFEPGERGTIAASDWCAAAQLASHAQYHNLFNGFISRMFEWYVAVVLWKTQSPWPSLRGFLYDWYLETTGSWRGTKAALGGSESAGVLVVFDANVWRFRVVNRSIRPLDGTMTKVRYAWIDLNGKVVAGGEVRTAAATVPSMSADWMVLKKREDGSSDDDALEWPPACGEGGTGTSVCFLRLDWDANSAGKGKARDRGRGRAWHWLTDPSLGPAPDFSALGRLRRRRGGRAELNLVGCRRSGRDRDRRSTVTIQARIDVPMDATEVFFYPTFSVYIDGRQALPVYDSRDADVVVLPGEGSLHTLEARINSASGETGWFRSSTEILVRLESWNGHEISQKKQYGSCGLIDDPISSPG